MVTFLLVMIGGLNLLVLGISGFDLGAIFGGQTAVVSKIIYILIGLSAVVEFFGHCKCCSMCGKGGKGGKCGMCGKMPCSCGPGRMDKPTPPGPPHQG